MPTQAEWDEWALLGDVFRDGWVWMDDVEFIADHFGTEEGGPGWDPRCDLNGDGIVDVMDLTTAANNYGNNIWDYFGYVTPQKMALGFSPLGLLLCFFLSKVP